MNEYGRDSVKYSINNTSLYGLTIMRLPKNSFIKRKNAKNET